MQRPTSRHHLVETLEQREVELQRPEAPPAALSDGRHVLRRASRQQLNSTSLPIKKQKRTRPRRSRTCARRRVRVRKNRPGQQSRRLCRPDRQRPGSELKLLLELEKRVLKLGPHQGEITTLLPRAGRCRILWASSEKQRLQATRDSECHILAMEERKRILATLRKRMPMTPLPKVCLAMRVRGALFYGENHH